MSLSNLQGKPIARVVVTGGRDYADRDRVWMALDHLALERSLQVIVHGAARGADTLAAEWAAARRVVACAFPVTRAAACAGCASARRWAPCAASLPGAMNGRPDITGVVAFPGGAGTADCIRQAIELGIAVWRPYG